MTEENGAAETSQSENADILVCGGVLLNVEAHQCFLNGEEIPLTPTEFALLEALCRKKGNGSRGRGIISCDLEG